MTSKAEKIGAALAKAVKATTGITSAALGSMMYRTNIQESDAMLFVLSNTRRANFWMKNCPESISAAYITPEGLIAEIHRLEANNTNGVEASTDNIRFVLETKEGWFERHHIGTNTTVRSERGTLEETFLRGR